MCRSPTIPHTAKRNCYEAGQLARDLGRDKTPSPGLGAQRRSWWLAGYNDRDIELQAAAERASKAADLRNNIPACDYRIDMEQN